ncbi:PucR family transcriptional regulator [Pseudonocardia acaciae]|uniref:PucR family transcriptional regulator n=1 Tax=Pseudonocardia acaciae TaxID=551276 RepID=UPI000687D9A7|nr:PucR family transcriptional regulator [Pseudonocardia acaciae]
MRDAQQGRLTVDALLGMDGLELGLLAGAGGIHREVRWAHAIELADPVPWLRGGELVLTIGLGLPAGEAGRRDYVRRLAEAGCAGLGFAAEVLDALPPEVLATAEELDFPVVGVLGATPFLAVSQAVAGWYSDAAVRAERRAVTVQEAVARAALRSGAPGIVGALARGIDGQAMLLDAGGRVRAAHPRGEQDWHRRARELVAEVRGGGRAAVAEQHRGSYLMVHSVGGAGRPRGWLAVAGPSHQRLLVAHAATLLAVTMLGIRAVRSRLHEQRARMFAPLLDGSEAEPDPGLLPDPPYEVMLLSGNDLLSPALDGLDDIIGRAEVRDRVLLRPEADGLVAVLPLARPRLGPRLRERVAELGGVEVRAGAATAPTAADLPAAVARARDLLPRAPGYAHADDVSAWSLLRDGLAPGALASFTSTVLAPLHDYDRRTGTGLAASLRAYLDADSNLEAAAAALGVHRNTLRARLRTAQRVAGRRLDTPRDRLELWLALSAPDLLGAVRELPGPPS